MNQSPMRRGRKRPRCGAVVLHFSLLRSVLGFAGPALSPANLLGLGDPRSHARVLSNVQSVPATRCRAVRPLLQHSATIDAATGVGANSENDRGDDALSEASSTVPALDVALETQLYAAIRERARIHRKQAELEEIVGRHASVGEWAGASGYADSAGMMAALSAGSRAQELLVRHHRPLVLFLARRYERVAKSLTLDDLMQEGHMGLLAAAEQFDPARGARFSTFAYYRVRAVILRAMANQDALIRVPVNVQDVASKLRSAARRLQNGSASNGRDPTDAELAAAAGVPAEVVAANRRIMAEAAASLTGDGLVLDGAAAAAAAAAGGGRHASSDGWFGGGISREDLLRVLDIYLAPRELEALQLRFGLGEEGAAPLNNVEIARLMKLSGEGIRKTVNRALDKLRKEAASQALLELMWGA